MTTTSNISKRKGVFYTMQVIRIFVGVLFIFSGLVKANDPSGLAYKMQEFFELWKMTQFSPFAFQLSIAVITFEIMAGVALLLGYAFKFFSILLILLMLFFAYLTGYAIWYQHHTGLELKCGCFGDCIPLTAMESFMKDLLLLALVIILFIFRKHIRPLFKNTSGTVAMVVCLLAALFIQWYAMKHLPFVDCLPYSKGKNIWTEMQPPPNAIPDEYQTIYSLKNTKTGEIKKVDDKEYINSGIWEDTLNWVLQGDAETKLIKKGNATPKITDFAVLGFDGNDYTEALLKDPGYNFLLFIKNAKAATPENLGRIQKLIGRTLQSDKIGFFILTSDSKENIDAFKTKNNIPADAFLLDGTVSKTAMRSNPGLMLIKGGTIIGKWSYADYPKDFRMQNDSLILIH